MNALAAAPPSPSPADPAVVRRALAWMRQQPAPTRAEAVSALARAYLMSPLAEAARGEALMAMTAALDDASTLVRRALAEALAGATEAPRHIVLTLAQDQSEVARIVLGRSPLIDDAALIDAAAVGDAVAQTAIARRPNSAASVAAALAEIAEKPAALALAGNPRSPLSAHAMRRIYERFGDDAEIREALIARDSLPADLRAELAYATAKALGELVADAGWLDPRRIERIARDASEQSVVAIARDCSPDELAELVEALRRRRALTVALLLRALLSGDLSLFESTLANLARAPSRRAAGFVRQWRGSGFAALYRKAGLPDAFLPVFRAAINALEREGAPLGEGISRALALRVIGECEARRDPALAPALALIWRYAGESAREDARAYAAESAHELETAAAAPTPFERAVATEAEFIELNPAPPLVESATDIASPALDAPDEAEAEGVEYEPAVEGAAREPWPEDGETVAASAGESAPDGTPCDPELVEAAPLPLALAFEGVNENYAPELEPAAATVADAA